MAFATRKLYYCTPNAEEHKMSFVIYLHVGILSDIAYESTYYWMNVNSNLGIQDGDWAT